MYTYTAVQLQSKTFGQLKSIARELDIVPTADRRCRQNWIDALVGVNPPLLQLLEVSPAAEEVELAAKAIAPAAKTKKRVQKLIAPAVKTKKRAQKPIEEVQALASFKIGDLVKSLTKRRGIKNKSLTGTVVFVHPSGGVRVTFFGGGTLDYSRSQLNDLIVQEPPITKVVNILKLKSPEILDGIAWHFFYQSPEWLQEVLWPRIWDESEDIDFVEMIIRSFCGNRILGCNFDNIFEIFQRVLAGQEEIQARELARNEKRQARKLEVEAQDPIQVQPQESIVPAAKNFPGVETDFVQEAIEQVAKISPGVESVQEPIKVQATEPITEAAKTSPGVEVDRALSHKFLLCLKEGHNTLWYDGKNFVCEKWSAKTYCKRGVGAAKHQLRCHPEVKRLGNLQVVENSPADQKPIEVQATELIEPAAKTSPGAEVDRVQHPIREMVETFPVAEVEQAQEAIAPAAKNLPGSRLKTSTAHQLLELFKSSAHIIEYFPGVKTEVTVSESAIAPAVKTSFDAESDRNPILTGIPLSDKFLARYSPPQAQIIHFQSDADGQLSLLDFEVQSELDPPDPDDFETLEEFRKAIARWDWEHSSSFDHFSGFERVIESNRNNFSGFERVHEPNFVQNESPLEVSLDSFCLWAPCPYDWYEPHTLLEPSKVLELSLARKSSSTSDFFIPIFDRKGDRSYKSNEPPDTWVYARLLKPKSPSFPPTALRQARVKRIPNASRKYPESIPKLSRNYPEAIPKLFHRSASGSSSTQPARSPPGGDASF